MEQLVTMLTTVHPFIPLILSVLGGLVVLGQAYVAITPTQKDDAWFAKLEVMPVVGTLLGILKSFAPVQRKDGK